MNGQDHYNDAELLINMAHDKAANFKDQMLALTEAQVHATLALASEIRAAAIGRVVTYE